MASGTKWITDEVIIISINIYKFLCFQSLSHYFNFQIIFSEFGKYRTFKNLYSNSPYKSKLYGETSIILLKNIYIHLYDPIHQRISIDNIEQLREILVENGESPHSRKIFSLYEFCRKEYLAICKFCNIIDNLSRHFKEAKKLNVTLTNDDFWVDIYSSLRTIGHCREVDWISTRIEFIFSYFKKNSNKKKINEMKIYSDRSNSRNNLPVFEDDKSMNLSMLIEEKIGSTWDLEKHCWSKYILSHHELTKYCVKRFFELKEFQKPNWQPTNYVDSENIDPGHLSAEAQGMILVLDFILLEIYF